MTLCQIRKESEFHHDFNDFNHFNQSETEWTEEEIDPSSNPSHRLIPILCVLLMIAGTAIVVLSYVVQNANAKYNHSLDHYVGDVVKHSHDGLVVINDDGIDFADPMICHHFLIAAVCWIA